MLIIFLFIILYLITVSVYIIVISPFIVLVPFRKNRLYFLKKNINIDAVLNSLNYTIYHFYTNDGYKLHSILLKANNPKCTIIYLHGISDSMYSHINFMKNFVDSGFNVFLYDARAHGESEGLFCTYGSKEKYDVISAIQFLKANELIDDNTIIGLYGTSLGGAVALQAASLHSQIKFCVIESAFSDLKSIFIDYRSHGIFSITKFFGFLIDKRIENIGGFHIYDVVPKESIKKFNGLVLYIHGSDDDRVNIKYMYENIKNTKNYQKYIVNNGKHNDIRSLGGDNYIKFILSFTDNICKVG